jgi:hypothetical protein
VQAPRYGPTSGGRIHDVRMTIQARLIVAGDINCRDQKCAEEMDAPYHVPQLRDARSSPEGPVSVRPTQVEDGSEFGSGSPLASAEGVGGRCVDPSVLGSDASDAHNEGGSLPVRLLRRLGRDVGFGTTCSVSPSTCCFALSEIGRNLA